MVTPTERTQIEYNKYSTFEELSYNILTYLIENNEVIWKLLKYEDPNAWEDDADHPDLTQVQKGALIYDGQVKNLNDYRVFLDVGQDEAFTAEACILRVSPVDLSPENYVVGELIVGFEVYSHYAINTMSNYTTRIDRITKELITTLNGAEITGLGRLFFDKKGRSSVIGQIPFKGRGTIMCGNILG